MLRQFAALSAMVTIGIAPIKVLHTNNNRLRIRGIKSHHRIKQDFITRGFCFVLTLKLLPHDALQPQKNLRFCCAITFALFYVRCFATAEKPAILSCDNICTILCSMLCNRRKTCDFVMRENLHRSLFYFCGCKAWFDQSEQEVKRWNETSQDGGPMDSNALSAILRQLHLFHESVVGSKLLSPHYPWSHPSFFFVLDAQDQDKKCAPSRSGVNIYVNAKWVKSTVRHVMRCALITAFPTTAVAKHHVAEGP